MRKKQGDLKSEEGKFLLSLCRKGKVLCLFLKSLKFIKIATFCAKCSLKNNYFGSEYNDKINIFLVAL